MGQFKYVEVCYEKRCNGTYHLDESYRETIENLGVAGYELRGLIPLSISASGSYCKAALVFEECFDPTSAWVLSYQYMSYKDKDGDGVMDIATNYKKPINDYCVPDNGFKIMAYIPLDFDQRGRIVDAELVLMRHLKS